MKQGGAMRVLVTATGGTLAPMNIKLMQRGQRNPGWVLGVDVVPDAIGRYFADAFELVPSGESSEYVGVIVDLARRYDIELILPGSDEEALALSAKREVLADAGAVLSCASAAAVETMNDKAACYRTLAEAGLRTPKFEYADTEDALLSALEKYAKAPDGYAVKPTVARGNRGIFVVRSELSGRTPYFGSREVHLDHATFMAECIPDVLESLPVMVSERLYAPAYDIDVLAQNGEVLRAMPRERMNPAGVPFTGGVLRPREDFMDIARRVTATLHMSWLFDIDLMTDRNGHPVVLEVNARPSGSIAAAVLAGVPFYEDLIAVARGESIMADAPTVSDVAVVPYIDCKVIPLNTLP